MEKIFFNISSNSTYIFRFYNDGNLIFTKIYGVKIQDVKKDVLTWLNKDFDENHEIEQGKYEIKKNIIKFELSDSFGNISFFTGQISLDNKSIFFRRVGESICYRKFVLLEGNEINVKDLKIFNFNPNLQLEVGGTLSDWEPYLNEWH